jgi:phosphatidylinositol alpha-1,6-mannosyltransferase
MAAPAAGPRALLLTPDFPPARGGIQTLLHRLVTNAEGFEWRVVAPGDRSAATFDRDAGIDIVRATSPRAGRVASRGLLNAAALAQAARFRPDVVVSGHLVTSPAAAAIRRLLRVPVVQYLYALEVAAKPRLAAFAVRNAERTIAISRYTRDLARAAGGDDERIVVIPPGVDLPTEHANFTPRQGPPTVTTVARLADRYKGHDVLVRALPLVRSRVSDARWVVVGDGPLRAHLEALASAHGVEDAVHFAGSVSDDERDRWLSSSDVFAMPSRLPADGLAGEGFGIVYLEAGARSVPVVAGDVGGALDAVVHGETGLLVDPQDHVTVASAISELMLDRDRARRMGRAGAEHARTFAWPKVAAKVEDVLREVARA